jgi:hypothetical protein
MLHLAIPTVTTELKRNQTKKKVFFQAGKFVAVMKEGAVSVVSVKYRQLSTKQKVHNVIKRRTSNYPFLNNTTFYNLSVRYSPITVTKITA